jgi:hypothetical protein
MGKLRTTKMTKTLQRAVKRLKTLTVEQRLELLVRSGSLKPADVEKARRKLTK